MHVLLVRLPFLYVDYEGLSVAHDDDDDDDDTG